VVTHDQDALLRWVPLLPLVAALVHGVSIGVVRRALPSWAVWGLSCAAVGTSFLLSLWAFFRLLALPVGERVLVDTLYTWIGAGIGNSRLAVDLGFHLDPLAAVMLLVVTGLSALIHIYASAYMEGDARDDRGYQRVFCYLSLATASMLVLVLADNLVLLFLGWQGVALSSWLLISFWYSDADNARFGGQAFISGRIGDIGFLLGTFVLFAAFLQAELPASLLFADIETWLYTLVGLTMPAPFTLFGFSEETWPLIDVVAFCFFVAAAAKSAQLPLSAWLRHAVAGPIPGSALMLGVTTLGAGVYLVCRLSFVFVASTAVPPIFAWTGALTALYAALVATSQTDIRKLLACLALCEVGLIFLALGCGAYTAALFHLVTHGVVMTLLLLAAGSVMRALQGETDLLRMGDLGRRLHRTVWVFLAGVAVLAGAPPGSVFFSKGAILAAAHGAGLPGSQVLYGAALLSVTLSAFALYRVYFLVFTGESRVRGGVHDRATESPRRMLWPLYALVVFAAAGGAFGIPQAFGDAIFAMDDSHSLANFMAETLVADPVSEGGAREAWLTLYLLLAAGTGFGVAYGVYRARPEFASSLAERIPTLRAALEEGLYLDRASEALSSTPLRWFCSQVLYRWAELRVVGGTVLGVGRLLRASVAKGLRHLHAGLAHAYVFFMIAGTAVVVGYLLR
jgi:NADH-quinone oxidoreductase subunit L